MKLSFILISVLTIGLTLRLVQLNKRILWFDEEQSVLEANGIRDSISFSTHKVFQNNNFRKESNVSNMVTATIQRDSGNGIIHTGLLFFWTKLFGNSNFSVRIVSVLFSILSAVILYFFCLETGIDRIASKICVMLFSLHQMTIIYAQEARPYSMATFFILLSMLSFIKIINRQTASSYKQSFFFGIFSAGALLTHYLTIYILLAEIAIALIFVRKVSVWKGLILGAIITATVLFIWMFNGGLEGLSVMALKNSYFQKLSATDPTNSFYGKTNLTSIIGGVLQMLINMFGFGFQDFGLRVREIMPLMLVIVAMLVKTRKLMLEDKKTYLSLVILITSAPAYAVVMAIISGHIISFQSGYSIFGVPFVCILMGQTLRYCWSFHQFGFRILAAIYVIFFMVSGFGTLKPTRHGVPFTGTLTEDRAAVLEKNYNLGDTLIIDGQHDAILLNLYFRDPSILQKVNRKSAISTLHSTSLP